MPYPKEAIIALGNYLDTGSAKEFNYFTEKKYRELILVKEALEGHDKAFDILVKTKHMILAAFLSAIWEEKAALTFLIKHKSPEWAATAAAVNNDTEAANWLRKNQLEHYYTLAEKIKTFLKENKKSDLDFLYKSPFS